MTQTPTGEDSAQRIVMTDTPNQTAANWQLIDTIPNDDGWVGRHLFAIKQPWGWEMWVGQRDAGYLWLVRGGDGSCAETQPPTHWRPLPDPPAS